MPTSPRTRAPRARVALLLLPALLLVTCGACGGSGPTGATGPTGPVTLEVVAQDWTGWSGQQPEPTVQHRRLGEGESLSVAVVGGELEVTVLAIEDDEVRLATSAAMAPRSADGDGWDHGGATRRFTLERGEVLEIGTPTLDGGTTLRIGEA